MGENFNKECPMCGNPQVYTSIVTYKRAFKMKSLCNNCSSTHKKKDFQDYETKKIIELYIEGYALSKIQQLVKRKKNRIKELLIEHKIWIEGRDNIKIEFNDNDLKLIKEKYLMGESCQQIATYFNTSKVPIVKTLKKEGLLRKGYSDGKKIELNNEIKEKIKKLYVEDKIPPSEISILLKLNKHFLDNHIKVFGYKRTRGESISIRQLGKKHTKERIEKHKITQQKLAASGKRKQSGGVCKFYEIGGLICQGTYEKFFIEKLIQENKKLPKKSRPIITPYGVYTPDFISNKKFIEIKSDYTYDILIGKKISRFTKKIESNQYEKIKWVNQNIYPVNILVVDKINNKIIKKEIK